MKSVIFISLLSLSLCYSSPAGTQSTQTTPLPIHVENVKPTPAVANVEPAHPNASPNETKPKDIASSTVVPTAQSEINNSIPTEKAKNDIKNETKTADKDNTTAPKPSQEDSKTTKTTEKATTVTSPVTPDNKKNEATTESNEKKEIVTQKTATEATTPAPKIIQASRAFDGASFVGGIILTLGLLAIGFMGFKYYKNQTERNYHTL